ncbi:MAG TPA: D-aminoacylase, partial [Thermodesulfobacteriota bacterium]|nr:D-aminoacylase [Thermodesulfobacteriota bacterium]
GPPLQSFLIRGATVVDGSGGPPLRADVEVEGDRIRSVGPDLPKTAAQVIDGRGLTLSPGFIDIHSHTDGTIFKHPRSESKILQGVTTEVVGNCGIGFFPVDPRRADLLAGYVRVMDFHLPPGGFSWTDFSGFAAAVERLRPGVNVAPLAGHGALRIAEMGADDRAPSEAELAGMKSLLEKVLRQGAWGMSTGLIYPPGTFAATDELIALAKIVARFDAVYTSHIRGESGTLLAAIDEAIRIGREGGARVEISHLKAMGKDYWGMGKQLLEKLEKARAEGVDITADQYPYEATSTSLAAMLPAWAQSGGLGEILKKLAAPELQPRLRADILQAMTTRGGPDRVLIAAVGSPEGVALSGKTVARVAALWSCPPEDAVIRILLQEKAAVRAVYFSLAETDVEAIMASPHVAVGSDGEGMNAEEDAAATTHPRSYGTFPRVLGRYAREKGILSLPLAVYKMTGLPASRLRLPERGLLKPGYAADLVLFDQDKIIDTADFQNPHRYASGIVHVWVNGVQEVSDGRLIGNTGGRVLRKNNTSHS